MSTQIDGVALINDKIEPFMTTEGVGVGKRIENMSRHLWNKICWKLKEILNTIVSELF